MANFYIERITAKGDGKQDSSIEFSPNLTIIYGASNTGKTYIFKVIDYLFGSKKLDIREDTAYTQFSMVLNCEGKRITISRELNKNTLLVNSELSTINSGPYGADIRAANPINRMFLRLLGIEEQFVVPSTQNGGTRNFSFRIIMDMAKISESGIESNSSIIIKDKGFSKVYPFAHLLYLLDRVDFSDYTSPNKREIALARRDAVRKFIDKKLEQLKQRIDEVQKSNNLIDGDVSLGKELLINELREIENKISLALKNGEDLLKRINETNSRITECDILISRYRILETQLVSDAKRLSFAFESEQLLSDNLSRHTCPNCSQEYVDDVDLSIDKDAIKAEVKKISKQIDGILSLCNELEREKNMLLSQRQQFNSEYELLNYSISTDLQPQKELIQSQIDKFTKFISLQSELLSLKRMQQEFDCDIEENERIHRANVVFKPSQLLPANFAENMTENIQYILNACGMPQHLHARFDINNMDVILGDQKKGTNGKGYTAFYNSVVFLAFRKYMFNNAKYHFPVQMIDTPLHGLDLGDAEYNIHNMRTGIYESIFESSGYGQLIVFDNEKNMPSDLHISINPGDVKYYKFTHDESAGRYGFLLDHRQE